MTAPFAVLPRVVRAALLAPLLGLSGVLATASSACAQGELSKNAPISIEAATPTVPAGGEVLLRGKTIALDTRRPIAISVTWLRGLAAGGSGPPPAKMQADYGADGSFETTHRAGTQGVYRVSATSPDGSGTASTEFTVVAAQGWAAEQAKAVAAALDASSDLVDALQQLVAQQPDSPARQQFEEKLQPLRQALAKRQVAGQSVSAALDFYGRIAGEFPLTSPAFEPLNRQVTAFSRESQTVLPQIKAAAAEARKKNRVCDDLVKVEEGFKLLSTMINFVGKFHETLLAFTIDFATNVAGNKAPASCGDGCKFAFTQAIKQRDWIKTGVEQVRARSLAAKPFFDGVPGFLADAGAFASHALFDRYCERFEGPVDGRMKVEYYRNDKVWWRYTVKIKGTMTLAYRKGGDAGQQVIPMMGHFVGTGTEFTVAEDALRVLHPKLLAGALVVGKTLAPLGFPYLDAPGAVALQTVPTAFFMAVEGELAGKKLSLKLGPSRTDFNKSYTVASGRYAIAGGYAGAFAGYTTFEIPYDSARGLVEKATDIDLKPIEIDVVTGKDKLSATATFTGTRGNAIKARGNYELKLQLCNPKC